MSTSVLADSAIDDEEREVPTFKSKVTSTGVAVDPERISNESNTTS
jgi:hypothetical protein